jgi:hypothetical protein
MELRARHLIAAVVVAINAGVAAYAALVSWLLAVWFLDDGVAARMTDRDWWIAAAVRVAGALVAAMLVATGLYLVNWMASCHLAVLPRPWPRRLALAAGSVVGMAGLAGAIQFLVTRPWF